MRNSAIAYQKKWHMYDLNGLKFALLYVQTPQTIFLKLGMQVFIFPFLPDHGSISIQRIRGNTYLYISLISEW